MYSYNVLSLLGQYYPGQTGMDGNTGGNTQQQQQQNNNGGSTGYSAGQ